MAGSVEGLWKLGALHPQFGWAVGYFLSILSAEGLHVVIDSGYRSFEEQEQLYTIGRSGPNDRRQIVTKARGGQSAHNYGLAVDLHAADGYDTATDHVIQQVGTALGFGRVSWDHDHYEHPFWKQIAQLG